MTRIANDLQAYYVLGYYTTNTTWDGGIRSIKVRLKPKKEAIRARRQYRAPYAGGHCGAVARLGSPSAPVTPSPEDRAFALLAARPSAQFRTYTASGADLSVVLEMTGRRRGHDSMAVRRGGAGSGRSGRR